MSSRTTLVLALLTLTACQSASHGRPAESRYAAETSAAPVVAAPASDATSTSAPNGDLSRGRDVIRTANVRLRHARPARIVEDARQWAEAHAGFVDDSNTLGAGGAQASSRATFRIPSARYSEALRHFRSLATVLEVSEHGEDVTLARADADARIAAKRALEQRLVALTEHTGTVAELIQVENELGRVRSDIESMEATQRALVDRVSYATITLSVEAPEQPLVARAESFGSRLDRSFTNGVRDAESLVTGSVALVTATSPLVALGLAVWAVRRVVRKRARPALAAGA